MRIAIEEIFGVPACLPALFYQRPGGLRFELSEGGAPLEQVLVALRKAERVCNDIFSMTMTLTVCLTLYAPVRRFEVRDTLRALAEAGISIPRERKIWIDNHCCDEQVIDGSDDQWLNLAFSLPVSNLQKLLWCAVVRDFGSVRPNPGCRVFLINLAQRLMVHPYDDRGMDVVGPNSAVLGRIYEQHKDLLLDHDRATMDATAAGAGWGSQNGSSPFAPIIPL